MTIQELAAQELIEESRKQMEVTKEVQVKGFLR